MEGLPVTLSCFAEQIMLKPRWTKDEHELISTENIKIKELANGEYRLSILEAKLSDQGKYKIVLNGHSSEAELNIKGILFHYFIILKPMT